MNKFKTISLSLLLGLSLASCEDILDDNINPDKAHTNEVEHAMPVIMFYASQSIYDHAEYNVYLSQCLTTTGKSQTGSYPYKQGWEFLNVNRHPQWRRHFFDLAKNIRAVEDFDLSPNGTKNVDLIARTIMLMSTQMTTDTFGPMPMLPENYMESTGKYGDAQVSVTPHYETQEDIYNWMFREADALITAYENHDASNDMFISSKMDRIYGGDLKKWKGLVHAMKARLLLRNIPNVANFKSKCQLIIDETNKAIAAWRTGDLMYGSWFGNEPRYNYPGGSSLEMNAPWSSANPKVNGWESRDNRLGTDVVPSKFFMEACLGVSFPGNARKQGTYDRRNGFGTDPRLVLLMEPENGPTTPSSEAKDTTVMLRYLENNIGSGATYKRIHYPDLYCGAYAGDVVAYNPLFTMEELYFIQAEAEYWLGNKAKACQLSKEATENNINRHLEVYLNKTGGIYPTSFTAKDKAEAEKNANQWEARFKAQLGAFLTGEETEVAYINASGEETSTKAKSCKEFGNERWFFNESEYTLSDLMMQKYIALYMQPEQWNDLRRYHYSNNRNGVIPEGETGAVYPTLRRPYNLYAAYWVDGYSDTEKENLWIQRLNYDPQTEDIYNKDEVVRVGAYKDFRWLQKPMIWAENPGVRSTLTN